MRGSCALFCCGWVAAVCACMLCVRVVLQLQCAYRGLQSQCVSAATNTAHTVAGASCPERARRERHRRRQQQQQQQEQRSSMPLSADPSGGLKGLMQVDMKGLYTAVHVAKSLGQLDTFR